MLETILQKKTKQNSLTFLIHNKAAQMRESPITSTQRHLLLAARSSVPCTIQHIIQLLRWKLSCFWKKRRENQMNVNYLFPSTRIQKRKIFTGCHLNILENVFLEKTWKKLQRIPIKLPPHPTIDRSDLM